MRQLATLPRAAPLRPARVLRSRAVASGAREPFVPPEPKRFAVDPARIVDLALCAASFAFRGTSGALAAGYSVGVKEADGKYGMVALGSKVSAETSKVASFPRPAQPLVLYEFEGCPFCKRVREAAVWYDLDIIMYPCPRDGPTFRPQAVAEGGKKQFPYFKDPNTGIAMYESDAIVAYLSTTYGDGVIPSALTGPLAPLLLGLSLLPRSGKGSMYRRSKVSGATQPLTLWAYEASPFCRIVRERLNELEVPHLLKTAARGSPKRDLMLAQTGLFQVPYLEDPNTGAAMYESSFICDYLDKTYAA